MMKKLEKLFSPIQVGPHTLKNRISYSPTLTGFASVEGEVSRLLLDYYQRLARGGTGMIFVGSCSVDYPWSRNNYCPLRIDDERFIFGLNKLAETIQTNGAVAVAQLCHAGRYGKVRDPVGPSEVPGLYADGSMVENIRALSTLEVEEMVEKFGQAAVRAQQAGFDMVDVHGGTGYLIIGFLSPATNKRNDKYGGSFENRMRFPLEIIARIKELCGEDYPVGYTLLASDFLAGGLPLEEGKALARRLEKAGVVYLVGRMFIYESAYRMMRGEVTDLTMPPWGYTQVIKNEVNIPVLSFLIPPDPFFMEKVLQDGCADIIHCARPLIADPDLPQKAKEGRFDDIRKCIDCWECHARYNEAKYLGCAVNADVGLEDSECRLEKAERTKKVVVVGGGPAGMEAARVAALRGHDVKLFEKEKELGGQLNLVARCIEKEHYKPQLIDWLEGQCRKAGVEMVLQKEVTGADIENIQPDAVVIATGVTFARAAIPGADGENVFSFIDVLSKKVDFSGKKVAVVGGAEIGADTALYLAEHGARVVIIRRGAEIGQELNFAQKPKIMGKLERYKVEFRPGLAVYQITNEGVLVLDKKGKQHLITADAVVIGMGGASYKDLIDNLEGRVPKLYSIGDCKKPRKIYNAIHEGFVTGRTI